MKIGIVVPHIFMQDKILPDVIFSPGSLAISLAEELQKQGHQPVLYTPGSIKSKVPNITANLELFEDELTQRGDTYLALLRKHPLTFITLARQVQAELIAQAFKDANEDKLDIVHIYGNEEELALPFAAFCQKPVAFTHHDPFNLLVKYRAIFPKYPQLNWISLSYAQRKAMPGSTNWIGNVYHGLPTDQFSFCAKPAGNYIAYIGRIIESKGVHLAIQAVQAYNQAAEQPIQLRLAGKHYATDKDSYWQNKILPLLDDPNISYVGFLNNDTKIQDFLGNASALLVPSLFEEPFGMVSIEALACGTPVLGLDSGALPEVIDESTGVIVKKDSTEEVTVKRLAAAIPAVISKNRKTCRQVFEERFSSERMAQEHAVIYKKLVSKARE